MSHDAYKIVLANAKLNTWRRQSYQVPNRRVCGWWKAKPDSGDAGPSTEGTSPQSTQKKSTPWEIKKKQFQIRLFQLLRQKYVWALGW